MSNNVTNGFIQLHRQLMEWEWYDDHNVTRLFIHCLLKANHKDIKWQGITIKRGSFVLSYGKLASEVGFSVQTLRTCLKKLELTNEITCQATQKNTTFTVVCYDKYQSNNAQVNKQSTSDQHTANKQLTTNNNDNNTPVGTDTPSLDKLLFDLGRKTLGDKAGGVIAKLKKQKGDVEAYKIIELASTKSDPTQYVMACLKPKKIGITPLGVGG